MKVSVITLHKVFNYGSILQAYATQTVFKRLGCEVEIVDYISEQRTNKRLFLSVPSGYEDLVFKKYLYLMAKAFSVLMKKKAFGGFIKKYIHLSPRKYITVDDLRKNPPISDIYVTGSDQVWNSTYNEGVDAAFFLDFALNGKKRIAYVASFGKSSLTVDEIEPTTNFLQKYTAISVREDAAVQIVERLGFTAECLIDPTLQIDKNDWIKIASERLVKKSYLILMLLYNEDNHATEYARKIADAKGLKLVKLSWDLFKPSAVDKLMTHRSPQNFLSLFYYADFVVTNSFHGLAFSINFNKEFIIVPRNEYNSRIESLLRLTGLESRMVSSWEGCNVMDTIIEYSSVNQILQHERKKATDFLEKQLKL